LLGEEVGFTLLSGLQTSPVRRWEVVDILWLGVLVLYLIAGIGFNAVVPLGEAPDEPAHFSYVRHVARRGSLPVMTPHYEDNETLEAFQPPLYYVLAAPFVYPFAQHPVHLFRNPAFRFGSPYPAFLHHPAHTFPWQGGDLAWHVVRLFSLILGAAGLWAVYRAGTWVFDSRWLALAATAYLAFNPQYIYLHSSVTNDVLAALVGNVMTLVGLFLLRRPSVKGFALAGLVLGLATLSKISTLTLTPGLAVALVVAWRKLSSARRRRLAVGLLIAIPLACSAWWFARNQYLYNDLLGLSAARQAMPGNYYASPLSLTELLHRVPAMFWQTFKSSWGYFGWLATALPDGVFIAILVAHGLAWLGLILTFRVRALHRPPTWVLLATALGLLAGFLLYARDVNSSGWHGRFLFPGASVMAVGFVAGWRYWFGHRERLLAGTVMATGTMLLIGTLAGTVCPMYLPPRFMPPDEAVPNRHTIDFAGELQLVGYEVSPRVVKPGRPVEVTLYWMVEHPVESNYRFFVGGHTHRGDPIVTRIESSLSQRFPLSLWPEREIVADRYHLLASSGLDQVVGEVYVEVFEGYSEPEPVGAVGLSQVVVRSGSRPPSAIENVQARFGEEIILAGYDVAPETIRAGEILSVTLHWQALREPACDYQVFVHVFDEQGQLIAQHDGPPRTGLYPTSLWRAGERIEDIHAVRLPAGYRGMARIQVGLYTLDSLERLPVTGPGEAGYPERAVVLTTVWVE
jgi:4-amino-4-deoxy-L-arabinose transferase-like glycosyltransferase